MKLFRVFMPLLLAAAAAAAPAGVTPASDWKQVVTDRLPLLGHRNWIVIADAAYPAQSDPGIETIYADAPPAQVMDYLFRVLGRAPHVTPAVFLDQELDFVPEADAPGITSYRDLLHSLTADRGVTTRPHDQLLRQLSQVSREFNVLIIKTRLDLPYTSVFLRLDCAYWPADAEARLRKTMAAANKK